jgi:hypothetical protein
MSLQEAEKIVQALPEKVLTWNLDLWKILDRLQYSKIQIL